jgi:hypothetical protein
MSLPPDLQQLLDDVDKADRKAEEIAARLTDAEFFWQPDEGRRWSVAQCLDHLATMNVVYGGAVRSGIARAKARGSVRRGPARPGFFGRKFVASMEPPVTRKMKAPAKSIPNPGHSREEILRAYRAAHDDVRRMIADAATIDASSAKFQNPFIPLVKVRVATGLHVIAAHDRRHLWQAEQVEKEMRAAGTPIPVSGVRS